MLKKTVFSALPDLWLLWPSPPHCKSSHKSRCFPPLGKCHPPLMCHPLWHVTCPSDMLPPTDMSSHPPWLLDLLSPQIWLLTPTLTCHPPIWYVTPSSDLSPPPSMVHGKEVVVKYLGLCDQISGSYFGHSYLCLSLSLSLSLSLFITICLQSLDGT